MKLFGITAVGINGRVGSQSDFNALRNCFLKRLVDVRNGVIRFHLDCRRNRHSLLNLFGQSLRRHQRWHVVSALLLHQVERFVVEKGTMLDRVDARANGPLCSFGSVRMSWGVSTASASESTPPVAHVFMTVAPYL